MQIDALRRQLEAYREQGKSYFTTSSFQSHSLVLLHLLSRIDPDVPVYFLNTGYHFPATIRFRDQVAERFGLRQVHDLRPFVPKNMQKDAQGRLLFTSDPDYCCFLNKTQPMEAVLSEYDVWINGVRRDQSRARQQMKREQPTPQGAVRFHPMLEWSSRDILAYRKEYDLPEHPMEPEGYLSIGCEPCTRKMDPNMSEREARWYGLQKSECGLHTDLIEK
jgi:phosphoadenosine phosphosulfate reductase